MTAYNIRSSTIIVLLIITLSTSVHAHPDVLENLDHSDFDWAFSAASMFAPQQFAQMTMSQTTDGYHRTASPRHLCQSAPRTQAFPNCSIMSGGFPFNNSEISAILEQGNNLTYVQAQQQLQRQRAPMIQQDRCATPDNVPGLSTGPVLQSWNDREQSGYQQFALRSENSASVMLAQPVFDSVYSVPAQYTLGGIQTQYQQQHTSNLQQFFPELDEPMPNDQQRKADPQSQHQSGKPPLATNSPQVLSNENLGYHNLHTGVRPFGHMQGWLGRASAAGDTAMPRLDTGHLAPPALSDAHLSPSSASSVGSSASRSRRRSKEDMVLGEISCGQCDAAFNTPGDLTHHLRSHQPYQSRNHVCTHCGKRFQYRKDLARHVPRHDPNRLRYFCPFPGCKFNTKGFGRQDHLDRHLDTQHRIDSPMRISRTPSNRTSS